MLNVSGVSRIRPRVFRAKLRTAGAATFVAIEAQLTLAQFHRAEPAADVANQIFVGCDRRWFLRLRFSFVIHFSIEIRPMIGDLQPLRLTAAFRPGAAIQRAVYRRSSEAPPRRENFPKINSEISTAAGTRPSIPISQ